MVVLVNSISLGVFFPSSSLLPVGGRLGDGGLGGGGGVGRWHDLLDAE